MYDGLGAKIENISTNEVIYPINHHFALYMLLIFYFLKKPTVPTKKTYARWKLHFVDRDYFSLIQNCSRNRGENSPNKIGAFYSLRRFFLVSSRFFRKIEFHLEKY